MVATGVTTLRRRSAALLRPRISAAACTVALLTLFAFGGGIFLANYSFNTPETYRTAAARAPEILYLPPAQVARDPGLDLRSSESALLTLANTASALPEFGSDLTDAASLNLALSQTLGYSAASSDEAAEYNASDSHASGSAMIASAQLGLNEASSTQHGYQSVQLAVVPEHSTTTTLILGTVMLLAVARLSQRRA